MTQDPEQKTSYCIKLTGKAEIEKPLELSAGYTIKIEGEVVSITEADNYDGSHIKIYKFKPIKAELEDKKGKIIKVKDTRSQSQKLRRMILWLWEQNESETREPEDAYIQTMNYIMRDVEFLYRKALEDKK